MAERRKLVDAITSSAPTPQERDFVFSGSHRAETPVRHPTPRKVARTPLTTRLRDDYAHAIKQASLKRQMDDAEPSSVHAIVEEAIGDWLRTHGHHPGD